MGREWLYKVTGTVNGKKEKYKNASSSGCMSAIYNLFDIQHQFRFHHPSFVSSVPTVTDHNQHFSVQGIEAPRNSLESPESAIDVAPPKVKEQTNLNIPVSRIKIKTNRSKFTNDLSSESCNNSPGTKTPNLVARLMGLDLLPEYSSPRASTSSHHRSRSLPVTPRFSTASRQSTDNNVYHHRLSLQIDKENRNFGQEHESLHIKTVRRRSETISRRLGTDITNTISPVKVIHSRRDSDLVLIKPKKTPATEVTGKAKLRTLDIKNNLNKPVLKSHSFSIQDVKSKYQNRTPVMKTEKVVKDEKIKRIASERYDLRLKKINQQKVFVSKKSTKKIHSFKKEMTSSSTTTRLSQKQATVPSNLNSLYNSNNTHNLKAAATTTTTSAVTSCFFSGCVFGRSTQWLLAAEVEEIVLEIEREILENLVHEIAPETVAPAGSDRVRSHVSFT